MKNFKLLLATTAILSTGLAMGALADGNYGNLSLSSSVNTSNTETIHMDVKFVEPLVLSEEQHLDFGTIRSPRSGQKVVVVGNSTGTVDLTGSTATQLYTSGTGAPHLGKLAVSGSTTGYDNYGDHGVFDFYFTNDSVDLTTGTGDNKRTCGTVTNFRAPYAGMENPNGIPTGYLYYYATFTVDSGVTANTPLQGSCTGSNTVTLVYGALNY